MPKPHGVEYRLLPGRKQGANLPAGRLHDGAHLLMLIVVRQRSIVVERAELIGLRLKERKDLCLLVVGQIEPLCQHSQHPVRIEAPRVGRRFARSGRLGLVRRNRRSRLDGSRLVVIRAEQV